MDGKRVVKIGKVYRHFKGHYVKVLHTATHSETMEEYVVYQHLSKNNIWVRPTDMFLSEVDHDKYPEVTQKFRFEEASMYECKRQDDNKQKEGGWDEVSK